MQFKCIATLGNRDQTVVMKFTCTATSGTSSHVITFREMHLDAIHVYSYIGKLKLNNCDEIRLYGYIWLVLARLEVFWLLKLPRRKCFCNFRNYEKQTHFSYLHVVCTLDAHVVYMRRERTPCAHNTCAPSMRYVHTMCVCHMCKTHALITKPCQMCTIEAHITYACHMHTLYVHAIWAFCICKRMLGVHGIYVRMLHMPHAHRMRMSACETGMRHANSISAQCMRMHVHT